MPDRAASRHLNYRGDCRANLGRVMGPNDLGEWLEVVTADYDPATDTTRLGLAYGPSRPPVVTVIPAAFGGGAQIQ